jgi:hypothetical protein
MKGGVAWIPFTASLCFEHTPGRIRQMSAWNLFSGAFCRTLFLSLQGFPEKDSLYNRSEAGHY